jgi:signal peptidase I
MSETQEQTVPTQLPENPVPQGTAAPKRRRVVDRGGLGTVQSLLVTITIAIFVITFLVQAFTIPSESMEKTLLVGDYLLVDKAHFGEGWAHWFMPYSKIQRQEIVVFRYPVHPTMYFVKRVIGLPGDRVRLIDKKVFVNGEPLNEPYVVYSRPFDMFRDDFPNGPRWASDIDAHWTIEMRRLVEDKQLIVPENCYFVMGDNRDDSLDSRYWGFVPRENIVGRPLVIYFSMGAREVEAPPTSMGDKLWLLGSRLGHTFQNIRWNRVVRLVK